MTGSVAVADAPGGLHDLLQAQGSWPRWLPIASAIGPVAVAALTFAASDVERPALLAALLVIAVAQWIVPLPGRPYVTATAMAVQHLGAGALGLVDAGGGAQQTSLLILCFVVGETAAVCTTRDRAVVTTIAVVTVAGSGLLHESYDAAPIWMGGVGLGLFCGLLIRRLAVAVVELKQAQAALEADAATRERQRIAREVHDVIAHSMTVTMLHLTAARMAVSRGDHAAATEALEEAERQGRRSLADIRATVGVLRENGADAATTAALPAAADLEELVDGYRHAGLRVTADVDDRLADVPAPVALAVHRVVQEALANVAKHATGASASVRVRVDGEVEVEVHDDGPGGTQPGNGHGLLGMRERAESLGGTFTAGPTPAGWRVRATLPVAAQ